MKTRTAWITMGALATASIAMMTFGGKLWDGFTALVAEAQAEERQQQMQRDYRQELWHYSKDLKTARLERDVALLKLQALEAKSDEVGLTTWETTEYNTLRAQVNRLDEYIAEQENAGPPPGPEPED